MLNSKQETTLLSLFKNEYATVEFYADCKKYLSILSKAANELGYPTLLDFLKQECEQAVFEGQRIYLCNEQIWVPQADSLLGISENLQIFFFTTSNEAIIPPNPEMMLYIASNGVSKETPSNPPYQGEASELLPDKGGRVGFLAPFIKGGGERSSEGDYKEQKYFLTPLPKLTPQEIFTQIDSSNAYITPFLGKAPDDLISLGITYFGANDQPIGEMWVKRNKAVPGTYFSGDGKGNEYNTESLKFGFKVEDNKIQLIVRKGNLVTKSLKEWRKEIRKTSSCYVLGLQPLEAVFGAIARRSIFVFDKEGNFLCHVRSGEVHIYSIREYLQERLDKLLEEKNLLIEELILLLADGDSNACTFVPEHPFSDAKPLPLGIGLAICPKGKTLSSKLINIKDGKIYQFSFWNELKKAFVGVWRYKNDPKTLLERIASNLKFFFRFFFKLKK